MPLNSNGIKTHRDHFVIDFDKDKLQQRIRKFFDPQYSDAEIAREFDLKSTSSWKLDKARKQKLNNTNMQTIVYRPFDNRSVCYQEILIDRHRSNIMKHILHNTDNLCFHIARQCVSDWRYVFINRNLCDINLLSNSGKLGMSNIAPLYLYPSPPENNKGQGDWVGDGKLKRTPNFNEKILKKIVKGLGLTFIPDHEDDPEHGKFDKKTINPLDILDYIYAILHSPTYRETYKEFLKIDFPKVPYPTDKGTFWQLVKLGREIRLYHLLEHENLTPKYFITTYPEDGDNKITTKISQSDWQCDDGIVGRIMINDTQYFDNIPLIAWEFYIGGYQPAQKWLKDRRGRELSYEDIIHYQKIIKSLSETHRLMQEIDGVRG